MTKVQHRISSTTSSTYPTDKLNGSWETWNQHPWIHKLLDNCDSRQRMDKPNGLPWVYCNIGNHLDFESGKENSCTRWRSVWFSYGEETSGNELLV